MNKKDKKMTFVLSEVEMRLLEKLAKTYHFSKSQMLRSLIHRADHDLRTGGSRGGR